MTENWKSQVEELINKRIGVRFLPCKWIEGEFYDCVSFVASVFKNLGTCPDVELPDSYRVYGKGIAMFELICDVIEATESFDSMDLEADLEYGDLLVFSEGERSHHAGIFIDGEVAHCIRGRGVVIDTFAAPFTETVARIYRAKNRE